MSSENNDKYMGEPENFWKESGKTLVTWLIMVGIIALIIASTYWTVK